MSLFNRRDVHQQKEGFVLRLLNWKGKSAHEEEEGRNPSFRTTYRQRQAENLWGGTRRSSCSTKIFQDICRRMSNSSRKAMHSSKELFANLGRSDGTLDPDELVAVGDLVDDDGGGGDDVGNVGRSTSKRSDLVAKDTKEPEKDKCDE